MSKNLWSASCGCDKIFSAWNVHYPGVQLLCGYEKGTTTVTVLENLVSVEQKYIDRRSI